MLRNDWFCPLYECGIMTDDVGSLRPMDANQIQIRDPSDSDLISSHDGVEGGCNGTKVIRSI